MTINKYIHRIQQEISSNRPYEDYVPLFEEYGKYLELLIAQNPRNVAAVCQRAAVLMELRDSTDDSIKIMEEVLLQFENELSAPEKARLYTNLAFFYEENGDEDKMTKALEKAVDLKPDAPNAYEALAICLTIKAGNINSEGDFSAALPLFERAAKLSDAFRYSHNYAVALYATGRISEARSLFEKLYRNDESEKTLYGLGACSYYLGDVDTARAMANRLAGMKTEDVSEYEIAGLFYLCGDYAMHNAMFDNARYYYEASWLGPYFYSLKALGKDDELLRKHAETLTSRTKDIEDVRAEALDDDYTAEDRDEYVAKLQKEIDDINEAYRKIVHENDKPTVSLTLDFVYGCYLMDCPRHQRA